MIFSAIVLSDISDFEMSLYVLRDHGACNFLQIQLSPIVKSWLSWENPREHYFLVGCELSAAVDKCPVHIVSLDYVVWIACVGRAIILVAKVDLASTKVIAVANNSFFSLIII